METKEIRETAAPSSPAGPPLPARACAEALAAGVAPGNGAPADRVIPGASYVPADLTASLSPAGAAIPFLGGRIGAKR